MEPGEGYDFRPVFQMPLIRLRIRDSVWVRIAVRCDTRAHMIACVKMHRSEARLPI